MTNYVCLLYKFVEVLCEQTSSPQIQYEYKGINEPSQPHSFESLRQMFDVLISSIRCLIADNLFSLKDLKTYLQRSYRELKPQLAHAKLSDDVITIIVEKYNIINVDCLEATVDYLDVKEAKDHIIVYKKRVEEFCKEASLSMCCDKSFQTVSLSCLLTCETVQFTLKWNGDEHKLIEVQDLLTRFFKSNHNRVYITDIRMNSHIIVTCYAPKHVVDVLLIETTKNDAEKEFEPFKLTIGYSTVLVLDESEKAKVIDDVKQETERLNTSFKELKESELHMQLSKMSKAKTLEIEKFTREKEATDILLVEKQVVIKKLTQEKEATDNILVEKQEEIEKLTREKEDSQKEMEMLKKKITSLTLQVREQEERSSQLKTNGRHSSSDSNTSSDFKGWMPMLRRSMHLKGYRRAVIAVFDSHFDKLDTVLEKSIPSFIEKVIEVQLMPMHTGESYASVYGEIKANLEFINSAEKVQTYYQRFLKILDGLGKPVADVGKSIAAQLSTLTGIFNLTCQYGLQFESLEEECDDDLIFDAANCMDDYEKASCVLGLSEQTLDSISQSEQSDVEKRNAVLMAWKRKNGTAATAMELVKAFLVMKDQCATETIFKYHSKKITSLPETHPIIPNWDDLMISEKDAIKKILIDENRSVREAYAIFVTQLMESFMERNVKPGVIWSLIYNYTGFKHSQQYHSDVHFMHSQQYRSDDSIIAVFSELSKHCTWFNYELFQFIIKVKGNEAEKMSFKTYVDEHFIPYLRHSVFEVEDVFRYRLRVHRQSQHHLQHEINRLKLLVPKDLKIGCESKAIRQNIAQLLSFKNDTVCDFEDYNDPSTHTSHYYGYVPNYV